MKTVASNGDDIHNKEQLSAVFHPSVTAVLDTTFSARSSEAGDVTVCRQHAKRWKETKNVGRSRV